MTFNILVYGSVCFHVIALTKNVKAITFLLFVDDSSSCTLLNSAAYRWLEKGRKNLDFFKFEYFCSINIICLSNFIFVRANPKLSKQMLIFSGQYINRQKNLFWWFVKRLATERNGRVSHTIACDRKRFWRTWIKKLIKTLKWK